MYLPTEPNQRVNCIQDVLGKCSVSLSDRRSRYGDLRSWYLYGADYNRARFNKIYSNIGTLASFLYAQESTRFAVGLGPTAPIDSLGQADAVADRLREVWHDSGADVVAASAVRWSLVFGNYALKFLWQNGELHCFGLDPGSFGVYQEELASLERQEAFCHYYSLNKYAVVRHLVASGKTVKEAEDIVNSLGPSNQDSGVPQNYVGSVVVGQMNPILLSAPTTSTIAGGINSMGGTELDYNADSEAENLDMQELWIKDDDAEDYRVVTLIAKDYVLYDRANIFVPHENPFVPLIPDPLDDYFWGYSQVDAISALQAWREKRMTQLDSLWKRQLNPPMYSTGFMGGIQDEKLAAAMKRGGIIANSQQPGAKIEQFQPPMPEEPFGEIQAIDQMFNETIGLNEPLAGQGSSGVRGQGHAELLAQMGSGRLIRRALNIEAGLERAAYLILKVLKQEDKAVLRTEDGSIFALSQFTGDCSIKVASHTSSPLFANLIQSQAIQLLEAGIIDGDSYLEMTDPPMAQVLRQKLKDRQEQAQKKEAQIAASLPPQEQAGFWASIFGGKKPAAKRK